MLSRSLMSSVRLDWNTPECVLDRVRRIAPIALDPCSNRTSIVRARRAIALPADGLASTWRTRAGITFVNPIYGRGIGAWTRKCVTEADAGAEIIALLPARPDTAWWQRDIVTAARVCFWRGRLTFLGAPGPAPFPSAIAYWGGSSLAFASAFREVGWVVVGGGPR